MSRQKRNQLLEDTKIENIQSQEQTEKLVKKYLWFEKSIGHEQVPIYTS
jgi:hypothetical protein